MMDPFQRIDLEDVKRVGIAAAYQAGEILQAMFGNISRVRKKSAIDLVTEADTASEERILQVIRSRFPDHGILAEESGRVTAHSACTWIIDPLDGTTNYAHRIGMYAVSIAFAVEGDVIVGIVLNPVSGELFTAMSGGGAVCNDRPIRVSEIPSLTDSLLVTGFPYDVREDLAPIVSRFTRCLEAAQGIRRFGSAALDLCHVACGRFEGFWEEHLKPWDTAAGMLVAREAGAEITDFSNRPYTPESREILATNGYVHEQMLALLTEKPRGG
ncbi:MAG: inositol monophosphatase family protein [Desulfobacterales bacterium]|jgi:myo-inositol-1(or 4)-monophosphatase